MGLSFTTYYGLARVSSMGPEVKGWAVTDLNPQVISLILKALTLHKHGGATPISYPGYNYANPSTPISVILTEQSDAITGGVLSPGTYVGVRLAFLDTLGLETDASPEAIINMSPIPVSPNAPSVGSPALIAGNNTGLVGGTYVYAITKGKGAGETQISSVAAVDVPFVTDPSTSYFVPITFDNIATYAAAEGVDSLYLYRATGLTSDFKLLKSFTDVNVASYLDIGPLQDANHNPPTANTYNKNKYVRMDWGALATPSSADRLRVYITQQPGVYGTNNLLAELPMRDPSTPLPSQYNYLGSETLNAGWPKDFSQLPNNPPKLYLNNEAIGAPVLTENMNFAGYESTNFVLPRNLGHSTPIPGALYFDFPTNTLKLINSAGLSMTLSTPTGSYVHPGVENGGHNASSIINGTFTQAQVNNIIANNTGAQIRKPVQNIVLATPSTTSIGTTSTAAVPMPQMEVGFSSGQIVPDFAGQYFEFRWSGSFELSAGPLERAFGFVQMELNGSPIASTVRAISCPINDVMDTAFELTYTTPVSAPIKCRMLWYCTGNGALLNSLLGRRTLQAKELF